MNCKRNNEYDIKHFTEETDVDMEKYLLYRKLFTEYIINELDLEKYDDVINSSELKFKPICKDKMDIFQFFTCDILRYFYIRNNIYIENLDTNTEKSLERRVKEKNYSLDGLIQSRIQKIYRRTISKEYFKDKKDICFFGPKTKEFSAIDGSIVIGFRYDESNSNEMNIDEWNKNFEKQQLWLSDFLSKLEYEFENILHNPVKIIKYNEDSIIPRISATTNKDIKI